MSERRTVALAAGIDIVAILLFVAVGRRSHDEGGNAVTEAVKVAAPFLIGLALGWLAARAWKTPTVPTTGMVIWVVTLAAGMVLRHFVFDRGTALAFIIVAGCFTLLFLVGWRFLWEWRAHRT
jgi:FtsH-binding integral membrane protein